MEGYLLAGLIAFGALFTAGLLTMAFRQGRRIILITLLLLLALGVAFNLWAIFVDIGPGAGIYLMFFNFLVLPLLVVSLVGFLSGATLGKRRGRHSGAPGRTPVDDPESE